MKIYDLIVIGGGVSGLTLASRAARAGRSVLLLEANPRLGGCIESWRPRTDFWLELGAHTAYNSYGTLLGELDARGRLNDLLPRKNAGYFFIAEGRAVSPIKRLSFMELLAHLPIGILRDKARASVADYYRALFGRTNYVRLLSPAFAAVLSQPADDYPAAWLFRRKPRLKTAPRKFTFAGGLQGLMEALATNAPFETRINAAVTHVGREADRFVITVNGESLMSQKLAVATPPDVASQLLQNAFPDLAARLREIPMIEIETVAVVVPKATVMLPILAGLIGDDDAYFSAVSRDPLPHPGLRGFTFHFKPGRLDSAGKRAAVARVLNVAPESFVAITEKINRLPALRVSHLNLAVELDALTCVQPLALVGNYFNGLSIGDCAERAAREAERLFAGD